MRLPYDMTDFQSKQVNESNKVIFLCPDMGERIENIQDSLQTKRLVMHGKVFGRNRKFNHNMVEISFSL